MNRADRRKKHRMEMREIKRNKKLISRITVAHIKNMKGVE